LAVELVAASAGEAQFLRGGPSAELLAAMVGQKVTKEGSRQPFDQLVFFIGPR
jgi:hypothetical protein